MSLSSALRPPGLISARLSGETVAVVLPLLLAGLGVAGLVVADQITGHLGHLLMIIGMTWAMMSPFAIPLAQAVARATLWWHAAVAAIVAVSVYLGVWALAGAAMHGTAEVLEVLVPPGGVIALIGLGCVAAQVGRRRLILLASCQITRPIRPGDHVRGAAHWAGLASARCLRVCAAPMMLTAVQPSLIGFGAVAALLWVERFAGRPALRVPLALGYLALTIILVLGTAAGGHPAGPHLDLH